MFVVFSGSTLIAVATGNDLTIAGFEFSRTSKFQRADLVARIEELEQRPEGRSEEEIESIAEGVLPQGGVPTAEEVRDAFRVDPDALAEIKGPSGRQGERGVAGLPGAQGEQGEREPQGDSAAFPGGIVVSSVVACPNLGREWRSYEGAGGRFLIGVGAATDKRGETQRFGPEDSAGVYQHKLEVPEMPKHAHQISIDTWRDSLGNGSPGTKVIVRDLNFSGTRAGEENIVFSGAGGSEPHNNMPPYIALHFCKKGAQ